MSLQQLTDKTVVFIKGIEQESHRYHERRKKLDELVKIRRKTPISLSEELSPIRQEIDRKRQNTADALFEELERVKEKELLDIKRQEQPITKDVLAELQLIEEMDLPTKQLQEYAVKYVDTPLALMKIKAIAYGGEDLKIVHIPQTRGEAFKIFSRLLYDRITEWRNRDLYRTDLSAETFRQFAPISNDPQQLKDMLETYKGMIVK